MASVTGDYQFSAEPRTVQAQHPKYRDTDTPAQPKNIMFDKRVVRGNTYAAMIIPASAQQQLQQQQEADRKRKQQSRQRQQQSTPRVDREASTPEPVEGREHQSIQTDTLIEELTDKPVQYEIQTQTDYFMDRPPTPLFMPQKTGEDQQTQIQDGELFHFDTEVDPILEVLVTKNLEQARMEVLEEEELESMRAHQREFEQKRNAQLVEVQRLEAEELRRRNQSERRKLQARTRKDQLQHAHQKFLCRIISKKYLVKTRGNAVQLLRHEGFYADPVQLAFHDQFIPWLNNEVLESLSQENLIQKLVAQLATQAFENLKNQHGEAVKSEYDKRRNSKEQHDQFLAKEDIRKQQRVEARIARQKRLQIEALRARIQVQVLDKCQTIQNTTTQIFSDIDGRQTDPIVGTPGGLFAEFIQVLSALQELNKKPLTQDQINNMLYDYVTRMRAPHMTYQNFSLAAFNQFLAGWDPNINIENVHQASEEIKIQVGNFLTNIENAFQNSSLTLMWRNIQEYKLREGLIQSCILAFVKFWGSPTKSDGSNNQARNRLEIRGLEYQEEGKSQAIVRIRIPLVRDPPLENEEGVLVEQQPREIERVEDRVILVPPSRDDLSYFVVHQAAQRFLRNEMVSWVKSIREFEAIDQEKLGQIFNKRALKRETKILAALAEELPVLDYEIN